LNVKLNKIGENMMKLKTAGFSATTVFKRSDFGIISYLPNIGDDVMLDIQAEANVSSALPPVVPAAAPAPAATK
jgi:polyisoprenoid-binding protein YceI